MITFWRYRTHWIWGESPWATIALPMHNKEGEVTIFFDNMAKGQQSEHFRKLEWEPVNPTKAMVNEAIRSRMVDIAQKENEVEYLRHLREQMAKKEDVVAA